MFHLQLRQFPHSAWRFNLSEAELRVILVPLAREEWVEVGERKWNPHEVKLTVLEGPSLEPGELSMGRGWATAQRRGEDITERVLGTVKEAVQEHARAEESARIEQAARAQNAAALAASGASSPVPDPLALGVQLATLLGSQPSRLLTAWQQAAASSPELAPSETLALAEQELRTPGSMPG